MTARSYSPNESRFGFGGHEKDDEVKGSGNHISFNDYGYDPRTGRRWNVDPVEQPGISPYAAFNNNPNFFSDPDGQSPISIFAKQALKQGIKKVAKETVERVIKERLKAYMGKKWATQFLDDALTAIDMATGQAWWEYAIEFIPVAGDIYGGAKLTEQGMKVYKLVQNLEKRAEKINDFLVKRADFAKQFAKLNGFQAHHIIPFEALTKNKYVQEAIDAGWDINKKDNGRLLADGFHTNHPGYTAFVDNSVNQWAAKFKKDNDRAPDAGEIKNYLDNQLTPQLNKMIDKAKDAWEKGGEENLNKFFKNVNSQSGS